MRYPGFLNLQSEKNNSDLHFTGLLCKYSIGEGFVRSWHFCLDVRLRSARRARAGTAGSQSGSRRFAPDGEGGDEALPLTC